MRRSSLSPSRWDANECPEVILTADRWRAGGGGGRSAIRGVRDVRSATEQKRARPRQDVTVSRIVEQPPPPPALQRLALQLRGQRSPVARDEFWERLLSLGAADDVGRVVALVRPLLFQVAAQVLEQ